MACAVDPPVQDLDRDAVQSVLAGTSTGRNSARSDLPVFLQSKQAGEGEKGHDVSVLRFSERPGYALCGCDYV